MAFDVFISYPHQDKATADAVCATLEATGVRCWIAPRDVPPGAEWAGAIVSAIDSCRAMVLIFSEHANRSKQVHREVQRAFDGEKPVVPFRIENIMPEDSLAYYMGSVHWLDALTPPVEQHLKTLAVSVTALLTANVSREPIQREQKGQEHDAQKEIGKRDQRATDDERTGRTRLTQDDQREPQGHAARRIRNEAEATLVVEERKAREQQPLREKADRIPVAENELQKKGESEARKSEPIKSLKAVGPGHYFVGACFLINGATWAALGVLVYSALPAAGKGDVLFYLLFAFLPFAAVATGVGTIRGDRWARIAGIAMCVVGAAVAYWASEILFKLYAYGLAVAAVSGACFYAFGWESRSRLARIIPDKVSYFGGFLLLFDALAIGLLYSAVTTDKFSGYNIALWIISLSVLELAIAICCVFIFDKQFGATRNIRLLGRADT
jgi:TIR domain